MKWRRWSTTALAGLLVTLVAGGLAPNAAAESPEEHNPPRVNLVLDVSGSMNERDMGGGESRIAAAQRAFNEVIDAVPEETHLGIRTLGATYPGEDLEVGCRDSEQLYPVESIDRTEAKTAVATLRPTGWTPIGYALRGANEDLGDGEGTRRVVLITDGEDSCGEPDPCLVAHELAASGTDLVVDTLGLTRDDAVREQLSCIAEATGGTYTAVQDSDQLAEKVEQLVRRADLPVEKPTVVDGAEECRDAPWLGVGVYEDREEFGEHRAYRVPLKPGQELRVAADVAADREVNRDYGVLLRALDEDGRELTRGTGAGTGRTDVLSTGLRWPVEERDEEESEDADDSGGAEDRRTVCLVLSHSFSAPDSVVRTPGLPVELAVDVVSAPDGSPDAAAFGLARGWAPVLFLTGVGLLVGLLGGVMVRVVAALRGTA